MDPRMVKLAQAMAGGAGVGAAGSGAAGYLSGGMPGALSGLGTGALSGAAVPLLQHMFPENPGAAAAMAQGLSMGPVGLPGVIGGGLELMGVAKPAPQSIQFSKGGPDDR